MNQDQFMSIVRALLSLGAGWLVGHGYQSSGDAELISGAVLAIAPVAWGLLAHTDAAKVEIAKTIPDDAKIAMVESMPDVSQIVTSQAKADANPSPKVVAQ